MKPTYWCAMAVLAATAPALASPVADHRALYELSLARTSRDSTVQGASGEMILEVRSACDAVTVNQMFRSDFSGVDAKPKHTEMRMSSVEAHDGKSFRFSLHNEVDGVVAEHFEGTAARAASGAAGSITYVNDAFPNAPLPAGAVFPTMHLSQLLATAETGKKALAVEVFDGAEKGKVYRAVAVIGRKVARADNVPGALARLPHWRIMISYFPIGSADPTPEYESSFDLYSNGVSANLLIDYGEFALRADLSELRLVPKPDCASSD